MSGLRALVERLLAGLLGEGPVLVWEPEVEPEDEAPFAPFAAWLDLRDTRARGSI